MNGNRIKEFRFHRGFTQDDIFLKTRIWPSKLSKIERGILDANEREKKLIAKALKAPLKKVFPDDEE